MEGIVKRVIRVIDDWKMERGITQNLNIDFTHQQKRILLCYLGYAHINKMYQRSAHHTNVCEMFQIIHTLVELDFCIDVCSFDHADALKYVGQKQYDYILGMGEAFRSAIAEHKEAKSIIYMTENPYYISMQEEEKRIDYLYRRRKVKTKLERTGKFYFPDDEAKANFIICMGETKYYQVLNKPTQRIYPTANRNEQWSNNTDKRKSTNFLVFGTGGFVHKGNDLLVEVFSKHADWNLYLCGRDIKKEIKKLKYLLPNNIHDCGYVGVNSERFLTLISECTYILLPSASEGMPTGVLTGMQHGLIPVVMHGIGMDEFEDYCEYFDGYKISDIENKLVALVKDDRIEDKSNKIYQFANEKFSLQQFSKRFKKIIETIMMEEA